MTFTMGIQTLGGYCVFYFNGNGCIILQKQRVSMTREDVV